MPSVIKVTSDTFGEWKPSRKKVEWVVVVGYSTIGLFFGRFVFITHKSVCLSVFRIFMSKSISNKKHTFAYIRNVHFFNLTNLTYFSHQRSMYIC